MNSAVAKPPPLAVQSRSLAPAAVLLFATLGLLWFILCRDLSLEWSSNEQYSYGWFVPFFALFLFWLRFEDWGGGKLERAPKADSGKRKTEIPSFLLGKPDRRSAAVTAT